MKKNLLKISTLVVLMVWAIGLKAFAQTDLTSTKAPAPIEFSPKTVLLTESFDGATFPPTGWQNIQLTGTGLWDRVTAGTYPTCTPHSGAGMAQYASYNYSPGASALLISPALTFAAGVTKTVDFWMYKDPGYATTYDSVGVYVNTAANLTGARFLGNIWRYSATAAWNQFTYTVPAAVTGSYYLIFRAYSNYGNNMFIDDVTVSDASVLTNDIGLTAIIAPTTPMMPSAVAPQVTVKNWGSVAQTNIPIKYKIGVAGTVNTVTVASLAAGATTNVSFPNWTATNGTYNFIFYSDLTGDLLRSNDTLKRTVTVSDVVWTAGLNTTLSAYMGSAAACGGKVYCMGGNQTSAAGSGVAVYDVAGNTWAAGPALPAARVIGMGAGTSTKVYMIGGSNGSAYQSTIWELTPPGTTWVVKTPLPALLGWADAVSYQDSLIYIMGGNNGTTAQSTVYLYNNVNNTVRVCTPMPGTVFGGAAGITGNTLVYATGVNSVIQATTYKGVIDAANHALITWTTGLDMPATYFRTDGGSWGPNEIIVANGSGSTAWTPAAPQPAYVYNPTTNVWRALPAKTTPTLGAYVATFGVTPLQWKLVAASGYTGAACTTATEILAETFIGITTNSVAQFTIYPNPVSDMLNIASDKVINNVKVYNVSGQLIYNNVVKNVKTEINTSTFANGMYLLQIESTDGISVQKFNVAK